jgi:hypothetical protein
MTSLCSWWQSQGSSCPRQEVSISRIIRRSRARIITHLLPLCQRVPTFRNIAGWRENGVVVYDGHARITACARSIGAVLGLDHVIFVEKVLVSVQLAADAKAVPDVAVYIVVVVVVMPCNINT